MNKRTFFILFAVIAVLVIGAVLYAGTDNTTPADTAANIKDVQSFAESVDIDVEAALVERVLGDPSAPIKISEHSSFTCSHCGQFHKDTFPEFRENYIDTGKAYLVFSDFPLNAPALHASMAARCLPQERYFDFMQMLFETQEEWAYQGNYMAYLQSKAAGYGLPRENFEACVQNKELQEGIVNRVRAAQTQWNINSTPSFVVNNRTVIGGALPYQDFSEKIEEAVNDSGPE